MPGICVKFAETEDDLRAVRTILAIAWIKNGRTPNRLFLPVDSSTAYLLAWIGDHPIGAMRLHWSGGILRLEKLSVIEGFGDDRIWERLFGKAVEIACARGYHSIEAEVRTKHVQAWKGKGAEVIGSSFLVDGAPAVPMRYSLLRGSAISETRAGEEKAFCPS